MNTATKFVIGVGGFLAIGGSAMAQGIWPLERFDRWGTGKQPVGPTAYVQPWKGFRIHHPGVIASCGAVIGSDGTGYYGTWQQNRVFKFDVATGAVLGTFNALNFVASMPVLGVGSNLYCVTSSGAASRVFEINRLTMDFNWFHPTMSPGQGDYYHAAPLIGPDGSVYIGDEIGQFRRIEPNTGTVDWSVQLSAPIFRTPAFTRTNNEVIVTGGSTIYALKLNGGIGWSSNLGTSIGAPGVSPSNVVVVGNDQGIIYGIDAATGSELWIRPALARVFAAPAFDVVGGVEVAYVASEDQRLYCIRVSDGVRLWTFSANGGFRNPPIVDNLGFIYVKTASGTLYKVSPQGAGVWQIQFNGSSRGPMTMDDKGTIFIGMDGNDSLYAVRQTPSIQTADNFIVERGSVQNGSLVATHVADNQYLTIASEPRTHAMVTQFNVLCPANSAYRLRGTFELSTDRSQKVASIQLFNFSLNRWDSVAKGLVNQIDSTVAFSVPSNGGAYVAGSTREIRIRLNVAQKGGGLPASPFMLKIDEARFEVEPVFQL